MREPKTSRPYQERFLDGFDRSQLRQEVQKVKPKRSLRQKYATWALGGALALGGVGIPMKFGNLLQSAESSAKKQPPNTAQEGRPPQAASSTEPDAPEQGDDQSDRWRPADCKTDR